MFYTLSYILVSLCISANISTIIEWLGLCIACNVNLLLKVVLLDEGIILCKGKNKICRPRMSSGSFERDYLYRLTSMFLS